MAFVVKDRIKETTTTTGTGAYTLAGAANGGYQTFADIGNANTTYYACTDGTDWEVGRGTYTATGTTLSRDEIIESSNSNNAVNWGSGSKDIFVTLPSSKALVMDNNDEFNVNGGDAIRFGANQQSSFPRMSLSINGSVGALGMSEPIVGTSTLNLTAQNLRGIGDDGDLHFVGETIGGASRLRLYGGNTQVFTTNGDGSGVSITGALSISGDLTVNGTTTTVNSTTVTIDDPIFTLGGDTAPASDDNKDRGIEFRWHNGSAAKVGFFGFDDSSGKFTFIPDATNTSEVFSGTAGTIVADIEGNLTGNADTASAADFLTGLADPDADRLLMWDDSAGAHKFVTLGSNLSFSGTTLNATDTNTTYSTASSSTFGLVKIGYTENGKNYPVELANGQMYVNVPWIDTDTTYSIATSSTAGLVKIGYTENGKNYPVELSSDKMYVNVPWTDTNTTYTAGTGLELSGTEFAINTTIVPRKGSSNTYEFNQEIEIPSAFAGYKQWSFVNTSGSDLAYLGFHGTNGNLQLRNLSSNDDVLITGHGGVELQINDGSVNNSGVRVFKLGSNVTGSIDWNGAARIQGSAVGANVVGTLSVTGNLLVTGTVDGVDIATRDGVLTTTTTTANAALPKAGGSMSGALTIATTGTSTNPSLAIDTSTSSTFVHSQQNFAANLTSGQSVIDVVGKEGSSKNSGYIGYYWAGSGSNSNFVSIGHWAADHLFRVYGDGTLKAGASNVIFHDGYHPNADKWTTARTLSLSGDASGSVSWDGSADATLSVAVSNDSHNHTNLTVGGVTDLNNLSGGGYNKFRPFTSSFQAANRPDTNYTGGFEVGIASNSDNYRGQLAFVAGGANQGPYVRNKISGTWNSWNEVWHEGNDGSGSGLDADTVDGVQASGFVRGDGTNQSAITIRADNTDFIVRDNADSTTNYIWRDHSENKLYLGTPNAVITARSTIDANSNNITGVTDLYVADQIIHTGDTDTYLQFETNDKFRVVIAGNEVQEWGADYTLLNDNDTLRLGSGSDFRMWHDGTNTYFRNYNHATGSIYFQGEDAEGTNHGLIYMECGNSNPYVRLYQNGSERLRTLSGGVGVTGLCVGDVDRNPHNSGGLNVHNGTDEKIVLSGSNSPYIRWQEGTTDKAYIQWNTDGYLLFRNQESGNWRFRGAGTTTAVRLSMEASDGDVYGAFYADHNNDIGILDDDNHWAYRHRTDSIHEWRINNGIEMSLSTSTLDMKGNTITEVEDIGLRDRIYHDGDTDNYMQFHATDQWRVVVGGTERLEVKNSSPHVLVTGDINSTSDARLKENVEPIANALSDITQLEGVSFDWKDTGTRGHGFIAQQVEPILPDIVQTDDETGIKSINYVGMIGHLVEAIKELKAEIEELKR